jgi:hypothetical protein
MLSKFKYKDWNFVEYINPKKSGVWDNSDSTTFYESIHRLSSDKGSKEDKVFQRLMDWFKHIDNEPVFDSTEIWDSLDSDERMLWFRDSRNAFDKWWEELTPRLKHYYTDRLMSDKPMLSVKDEVYKNKDIRLTPEESVQVTIINDKLAITSSKIEVLENIKIMIEKLHGEIEYEHRTKSLPMNKQSHTFIFDLRK